MNTATTATLSTRQLQFRAAKRARDAKINAPVVRAMFGTVVDAENDFTTDANGRKARLSKPSDIEIAHVLRGNRVLDSLELLELLGEATWTKLIQNGSLRRSANHKVGTGWNVYWITKKAADIYGIPADVTLACGAAVALVD